MPDEGLGSMPGGYDEDRLVVVPKDPEWLFLVWDLSRRTREEAAGKVPGGREVLRLVVTDLEGRDRNTEIEVGGGEARRYVRLKAPGAFVQAELGLSGPDGSWFVMARSVRTVLPVNVVRPGRAEFAEVPFDSPLGRGRIGTGRSMGNGSRLLTEREFEELFGSGPLGSSGRPGYG